MLYKMNTFLTDGYSDLTDITLRYEYDWSFFIGHVILLSLHALGLSRGNGTSTPAMCP